MALTLPQLKTLFRKNFPIKAGGPTGVARAKGLIEALDKLAEAAFAAGVVAVVAATLVEAQALLTATPPAVAAGSLYTITGNWNAASTPSTVYVQGLSTTAFDVGGALLKADNTIAAVTVNVAAGTYVVQDYATNLSVDTKIGALDTFKPYIGLARATGLRKGYDTIALAFPDSQNTEQYQRSVTYGVGIVLLNNGVFRGNFNELVLDGPARIQVSTGTGVGNTLTTRPGRIKDITLTPGPNLATASDGGCIQIYRADFQVKAVAPHLAVQLENNTSKCALLCVRNNAAVHLVNSTYPLATNRVGGVFTVYLSGISGVGQYGDYVRAVRLNHSEVLYSVPDDIRNAVLHPDNVWENEELTEASDDARQDLAPWRYEDAPANVIGGNRSDISIGDSFYVGSVGYYYTHRADGTEGWVRRGAGGTVITTPGATGPVQRTGTVLAFDKEADYAELFSGTFTVDTSTKTPGIVVKALLAAGCSAISLPSTDFERVGTGAFVDGAAHLYLFSTSTATGKIQYTINQRS
jgi:hypothetical protein